MFALGWAFGLRLGFWFCLGLDLGWLGSTWFFGLLCTWHFRWPLKMWSPYAVRLELVFRYSLTYRPGQEGAEALRYEVWQHFQPNHCDYLTAGKQFTCKASRGRSSFWYLPASCVRSSWFNTEFETVQLFVRLLYTSIHHNKVFRRGFQSGLFALFLGDGLVYPITQGWE